MRILLTVVIGLACFVVTWSLLADVLAVDRGLDITDEGLYLLSADPPTPSATWQFPFGWHTKPLLSIVDHNVANFRTLGAVILVAVSAVLGWVAVRVTASSAPQPGNNVKTLAICGAFVGGVGSLLYFGGFLRTPSYNWITLIGITIAASAQILYVALLRKGEPKRRATLLLMAICSFGLFYSFPGKPSTPVFMAIAGFALVALFGTLRKALLWTAGLTATTLGWIVVASILDLWPADALPVFTQLLDRPVLTGTQDVTGAILSLLSAPLRPWLMLSSPTSTDGLVLGTSLGAVSLVLGTYAAVGARTRRWMWAASCWGLLLAALILVGTPSMQEARGFGRWAYAPVVTACLFVLGAAVIWVVERRSAAPPSDSYGRPEAYESLKASLVPWGIPSYLTVLPFIFGFGSSNGAYDQAANAAGLFLIAAVAMLSLPDVGERSARMALVISIATLAFVTVTIYESRQAPYRNPPIAQHDVPIAIGDRGHTLLLDPDLAGVLNELSDEALNAGWIPNTPIVGLQWRWSTTIPYVLGGQVPDSLMLTIFGYVGTVDRAAYNLAHASEFPIREAWIIATSADAVGTLGVEQTRAVADELAEAGGNSFPDNYVCVVEVASFQLWRPTETADRNPTEACQKSDLVSNYDASVGWQP